MPDKRQRMTPGADVTHISDTVSQNSQPVCNPINQDPHVISQLKLDLVDDRFS